MVKLHKFQNLTQMIWVPYTDSDYLLLIIIARFSNPVSCDTNYTRILIDKLKK